MKRITGTHVYGYARCAHAVALDLHGDRELRRPYTDVEEFVLRRGRELEVRLTEPLGWCEPDYPERDFEAGAAATLALLQEGVEGVLQGVLVGDDRLGIPDLLRREDGPSNLGAHHYVIGDVKSSRRARGDQILQIMFYSVLLAEVQGREPEYAYLTLRDGREERFACRDFAESLAEVDANLQDLLHGCVTTRACLTPACQGCRWSTVCLPELEKADDLSLLQGMTAGLRRTLESAGVRGGAAAQQMSVEPTARRTHVESALLRRVKKAAQARADGQPVWEKRVRPPHRDWAVVHLLQDPFVDRVHWIGLLHPEGEGLRDVLIERREDELEAFSALVASIPEASALWHYGERLPRWFEDATWAVGADTHMERRFVDLARRLAGAACFPAPVFGLDDHVRLVLQRDPHRAGEAGGVGLWLEEPGGAERVVNKGRQDLEDLLGLVEALRGESVGRPVA
ncbi:MAG: TM0106 family RecB-like putative nuclease [Planctomycetota bacterium]